MACSADLESLCVICDGQPLLRRMERDPRMPTTYREITHITRYKVNSFHLVSGQSTRYVLARNREFLNSHREKQVWKRIATGGTMSDC